MRPRSSWSVQGFRLAALACLGAGCDGFLGPEPQFDRYAIKAPWPCGADGPFAPAPLGVYVQGKEMADDSVAKVDVRDLPFGQPVYVYGLLQHIGPDYAAAWLARVTAQTPGSQCQVVEGGSWDATADAIALHGQGPPECEVLAGAKVPAGTLKFRVARPFLGPLDGAVDQVKVTAHSGSSATTVAAFQRTFSVKYMDVPSVAQVWPGGPLVLVRREKGPCADAFLVAYNPGVGHAPAPALTIANGRPSLTLSTWYDPVGSQGPAPAMQVTGSYGELALPQGWQLDPLQTWVWHVEHCATPGEPPLNTTISLVGNSGTSWTFAENSTSKYQGCLRLAQGETVNLNAQPWSALTTSKGLRLDLVNVCDSSIHVGLFDVWGSQLIQVSAGPFGTSEELSNFKDGTPVTPYRPLPLYVRHVDPATAPLGTVATYVNIQVDQGPPASLQFLWSTK